MAKTFSGKYVIMVLCRGFGFFIVSQRGSHVKLRKNTLGKIVTTIIPLHKELSHGTLKGILDLAEVAMEEFMDKS